MHRSGTSAITRVVSLLGAALPEQLIAGRGDNERGFWEGRAVVELDQRALDRFGSWWGGWEHIDRQRQLELARLVGRGRRLVREEFAHSDLVVLKDPRMSRLLPLWELALQREGFRCVHVVALRHPGAVANSLARRNGLSPQASTLSWLAHTLDAELHSRAQPRVFVSFERFLDDWRGEVDRIAQHLDLAWSRTPDEVDGSVGDFIEPGLVHEPPASALQGPVATIKPVYDVLRRWSEDEKRPGDGRVLDSWREWLEPVRQHRSAVARMTLERREVIADTESRGRQAGPLGSIQTWAPIQYEGHSLEASAAWAWLMRERQHSRELRRSSRQAAGSGRTDENPGARVRLPGAVQRLRRRLPFPGTSTVNPTRRRGE